MYIPQLGGSKSRSNSEIPTDNHRLQHWCVMIKSIKKCLNLPYQLRILMPVQ